MIHIHAFSSSILEKLANAIADIDSDITGGIRRLLLQSNIDDVSVNEQFMAKRKKLYNAFLNTRTLITVRITESINQEDIDTADSSSTIQHNRVAIMQ
ncbi:MAG: hypothetical protein ACI4C3_01460 [Bacteroides sp.]